MPDPPQASFWRDRRFALLVGSAILFSAFSAVWLGLHPGHDRFTVALDDFSETLAPLAAAVACFLAARRPRVTARSAWTLIGLSALSWGLGQGYWTYGEVIRGWDLANLFPSYADLGYLTAVPLAVAGLIRLPGPNRGIHVQLILDGLLIGGGTLFVSWATVLGPIYTSSPTGLFQQLVSMAYPIGDVLMVTVLILVVSRLPGTARLPFFFLGMGLLLNTVADSTFAYLTTVQNYDTSNPVNVGWTLGYLLIALGAVRVSVTPTAAPDAADEVPRFRVLLPYAPLLIAGLAALADKLDGVRFDDVLIWDGMGIIAVVLIRQLILVASTRRLDRQLREQNRRLDQLVADRTRALHESLDELREANDEGRQLLLRLVTLQDEERRRLSAIIHDDMLQWMTVARNRLYIARGGIRDEKLALAAQRADAAIQSSITSMRGLMSELHPQLAERGFSNALNDYLEQVEADGDLHCILEGRFATEPSGIVATTLYRITCEAMVNARKHAPGATVTVKLCDSSAGHIIRVSDDGPGFVPEGSGYSPTGHVGLSAMRERAEALGGYWTLQSAPGEGTRVEFCVPRGVAMPVIPELPSVSAAPLANAAGQPADRAASTDSPHGLADPPLPSGPLVGAGRGTGWTTQRSAGL
ncbi:MAG: ATP-binding protein [Candidatus Dormiibacterota bacterium]